jgi:hypothetical protein
MIGALLAMLFQTVAGAPAPAPVATTPAPAAAEAVQETETEREARLREIRERQKLVCRNERVIGSRLPVRRCTSAADDANETNDSRQWIDRVQSQMPTKGG